MELNDTVCFCFHITKRKVINFIRVHKPRVASQISDCGGAGTGCGWCRKYLTRYFHESAEGSPGVQSGRLSEALAEAPEITLDEYAKSRANYIRSGHGKPAPGAIPLPD
ncbi:MAG: (2Fe-2S)-binding protein [Planctomyces sp.]|nr:(2Fe-2S)-binding protein [Planctomyces sp.]